MVQLNIEKAPSIFQSLSDATRLRILRIFLASTEPLCLCDVSAALEEPAYKVSRHLKALREVGILEARRDGKWLYHSIPDERETRELFEVIESIPDANGMLKHDITRLRDICAKRRDSRCEGRDGKRGERA